jgi:hypothetical protein
MEMTRQAYAEFDSVTSKGNTSLPFSSLPTEVQDGWQAAVVFVIAKIIDMHIATPGADKAEENIEKNWIAVFNLMHSFDSDMLSYNKENDGTLNITTRRSRLIVLPGYFLCANKAGELYVKPPELSTAIASKPVNKQANEITVDKLDRDVAAKTAFIELSIGSVKVKLDIKGL